MVNNKENILIVENLSKVYLKQDNKPHWAIKNISFNLEKGSVLGVVGKNGSGKSTLLKIIAGIVKPTEGEVLINGSYASIIDVGSGFHPDLTGLENIELVLSLRNYKLKDISTFKQKVIAFSELGEAIKDPVKEYSNGMFLRLAFSIIVFLEVELLLLDEVFAMGDLSFQLKCLKKMKALAKKGISVVIVSHNVDELFSIADKGLYLKNGCLQKYSSTFEAISSYLHDTNPKLTQKHKNSYIKDLSLSITDEKGKQKHNFFSDEDIVLLFSFLVKRDLKLDMVITVSDASNKMLLADSNSYRKTLKELKVKKGEKVSGKALIPKNVLNRGSYFIGFGIADSFNIKEAHMFHNLASFNINLKDWQIKRGVGIYTKTPFIMSFDWKI